MARDEAFRNAELEIEEARRSGSKELTLSGEMLTELLESLGALTQLQWLNLSKNRLTQLPDFLGALAQLQRLHLTGNQLTQLPDFLGALTQLQSLDLSGNQLTQLPLTGSVAGALRNWLETVQKSRQSLKANTPLINRVKRGVRQSRQITDDELKTGEG